MTVQASCADNDALDYVREQEQKLADIFAYVPRKIVTLLERLSREIERLEGLLPNFHPAEPHDVYRARALLDTAKVIRENEDELPMPELIEAMRRVNL